MTKTTTTATGKIVRSEQRLADGTVLALVLFVTVGARKTCTYYVPTVLELDSSIDAHELKSPHQPGCISLRWFQKVVVGSRKGFTAASEQALVDADEYFTKVCAERLAAACAIVPNNT